MTYRFATKKIDGRICCAGNNEDFPRCQNCKAAETQTSYTAPHSYGLKGPQRIEYAPNGTPDTYGLAALRRKREGR